MLSGIILSAAELETKAISAFTQQAEWSIENPTYADNSFDLVATVVFVHEDTEKVITTEMFFSGANSWSFRFTGTLTGRWDFTTFSTDSDLDGHFGQVQVNPSEPDARGFLTTLGQKFARERPDGDIEAILFNVYMNERDFPSRDISNWNDAKTDGFIAEAAQYGFNTIFINLNNQWFSLGHNAHDEHNSINPDLNTFQIIEGIIRRAHSQGAYLHIWKWGDEQRKWTPNGVGGINGEADRRLQRYIAARLGPLPGWTMSYGFDLHEWVNENQIQSWVSYMNDHMGWKHLLWARDRSNSELDVKSYPSYEIRTYAEIVADLNGDPNRPQFYEERHTYYRNTELNMQGTRRFLWDLTMAGGAGGWWGFFDWDGNEAPPYDNPEMLLTHSKFWEGRFQLDLQRANSLTDGVALRDSNFSQFVFYKPNTSTVQVDLTGAGVPLAAVAVNVVEDYVEIPLGDLSPDVHNIELGLNSDWAIAVGISEGSVQPDILPPEIETGSILNPATINIRFNEPVDTTSAEDLGNYGLDQGVMIFQAQLETDLRTVLLTTSKIGSSTNYVLTVNNVIDRSPAKNPILENTQVNITANQRVESGLVTLYQFNEGEGEIIYDSSGFQIPSDLQIYQNEPGSVVWVPGALEISGNGIIRSEGPATKVIEAVESSKEITIETWIIPDSTTQSGPARMVSISEDAGARNVTLGQQGMEFHARLRTAESDNNGIPSLNSDNVASLALQHLVYTCDSMGNAVLYLNNTAIETNNVGVISNWDPNYPLALANEITEDRPWLGQLSLVAIYNRSLTKNEIQMNFLAGSRPFSDFNRYESWALELPIQQREGSADPDGDFFETFLEYSLGGNPLNALEANHPTAYYTTIFENYFSLILYDASRTDVYYRVEYSPSVENTQWEILAKKEIGSEWMSSLAGSMVSKDGKKIVVTDSRDEFTSGFYRIVVSD